METFDGYYLSYLVILSSVSRGEDVLSSLQLIFTVLEPQSDHMSY